jgi:cation diffusion facilitator CzcD-associated flavoprotein CzcO
MACNSLCGRIQGTLPFLLRSSVEFKQIRPVSACQTWNQDGDMEPMIGRKMVAIIGAGPAGLVAAKSMLEVGLFPTLFDKLPDLGGVWNPQSSSCWFSLRTNDSRYSCCFSDFPWDSDSPIFPSQHDVYGYLQAYANKFLQPVHFCLGSEVTNVSRSKNDKWLVQWSSLEQKYQGSKAGSQIFDFVVFASGFFSIPYTPSIQGLDGFPGEVMHSSEYRSPERFRGKRVVILGASFSSAEVAADLAPLATEVINIVRRPFWVLPRYIALDPDSASTPFFPLDLVLYRRSTRQSQGEEVFANEEENRKANQYFRKLCGDQGPLNLQQDTDPPIIAISDSYLELVRSNHIMVRRGKVQEVQGQTVILEDQTTIPEVDCIIFCTGFQSSMPYLSSNVLDTLSFDPADRFVPFLLHRSTFHPSLPGSAFVGMYRGTFFGVMELQARWAAAIFSGDLPPIPESVQQEGIAFEKWIKSQTPQPQFPHGDYVGFADTFAADLNVLPSKDWYQKHDISIPAHFRRGSVAEEAVEVLEKACKEFLDGKMVPHAVFRSLAGSWTLHRHIENRIDFANSGEVKGTATFSVTELSHEYLYTEVGELSMQRGQHFRVHRKYVYVYDTHTNQIDVFFENQGSRGSPFHSLQFQSPKPSSATEKGGIEMSGGWRAAGQHICGEDLYNASYRFSFSGNSIAQMEISYSVTGPKKDYTSTATYFR